MLAHFRCQGIQGWPRLHQLIGAHPSNHFTIQSITKQIMEEVGGGGKRKSETNPREKIKMERRSSSYGAVMNRNWEINRINTRKCNKKCPQWLRCDGVSGERPPGGGAGFNL